MSSFYPENVLMKLNKNKLTKTEARGHKEGCESKGPSWQVQLKLRTAVRGVPAFRPADQRCCHNNELSAERVPTPVWTVCDVILALLLYQSQRNEALFSLVYKNEYINLGYSNNIYTFLLIWNKCIRILYNI